MICDRAEPHACEQLAHCPESLCTKMERPACSHNNNDDDNNNNNTTTTKTKTLQHPVNYERHLLLCIGWTDRKGPSPVDQLLLWILEQSPDKAGLSNVHMRPHHQPPGQAVVKSRNTGFKTFTPLFESFIRFVKKTARNIWKKNKYITFYRAAWNAVAV